MRTDDISMDDTTLCHVWQFFFFLIFFFLFAFVFWVCETSSHIRRHGEGWISEHHEH